MERRSRALPGRERRGGWLTRQSSRIGPGPQGWILAAWSFAVHGAFLAGSPERATPISFLFFGDSLHFLAQARHVAEGLLFNEGLPFHPPLTGWLIAPLWWLMPSTEAVSLSAKLVMAAASAASLALLFRLLRGRVEHAFWIVALLPLGFGEILLSASVNSEILYRLLIVSTLLLGWRRPLWTGVLQGLAALTRAEHLPFVLLLGLVLVLLPDRWARARDGSAGLPAIGARRRYVALALAGLVLVLAPYTLYSRGRLAEYNRLHADRLERPLPTLVPVSFYGPLNFALAQREADVYFSRRSLPPAPGGLAQLDPTFGPHQRFIVDGYRLGLETIVADPGRFVRRTARKVAISLRALGFGWSWRDLPHGDTWIRRPVDVARAPGEGVGVVVAILALLGAWRLRSARAMLVVGGLLVAYRLTINAAFFPYLRSMLIVAPVWSVLAWHGFAAAFGKRGRAALIAALLILGVYHLTTAPRPRRYALSGERDATGSIIDDRTVTVRFEGFADRPGADGAAK